MENQSHLKVLLLLLLLLLIYYFNVGFTEVVPTVMNDRERERGGEGGSYISPLHCHHQNDFRIKMGRA